MHDLSLGFLRGSHLFDDFWAAESESERIVLLIFSYLYHKDSYATKSCVWEKFICAIRHWVRKGTGNLQWHTIRLLWWDNFIPLIWLKEEEGQGWKPLSNLGRALISNQNLTIAFQLWVKEALGKGPGRQRLLTSLLSWAAFMVWSAPWFLELRNLGHWSQLRESGPFTQSTSIPLAFCPSFSLLAASSQRLSI